MHVVEVDPDDEGQIQTLTRLVEAARAADDPDAFVLTVEDTRNHVRYSSDLQPARFSLLIDDSGEAVGHLWVDAPVHDNRHLVHAELTVHPDHRGLGHDALLLDEILRQTRALGRTTLWVGIWADDDDSRAFLGEHGFARASQEARRFQVLADLDAHAIDGLERDAARHTQDYVLERLDPPYDDALLTELITVTAAINDAPMGDLVFEDEVFDLDRMRDAERARELRGERFRRVVARHRNTGEVAGHTFLIIRPWDDTHGAQWDTAVSRAHRGHRLGVALKIEMMRWLAETEPQLTVIETWNNVQNAPMINVNEALGYRYSRTFSTFQRQLTTADDSPDER